MKKKKEFPKGKSEIFKAKGEIRRTRAHQGRNQMEREDFLFPFLTKKTNRHLPRWLWRRFCQIFLKRMPVRTQGNTTIVGALLADTLLSGQLYTRVQPPSQNSVFSSDNIQTLYFYIPVSGYFHLRTPRGCSLTTASTVYSPIN